MGEDSATPPALTSSPLPMLPRLDSRLTELRQSGATFFHYTSAASGHLILKNRQFWLRNARLMNDYSEIRHGMTLLRFMMDDSSGRLLIDRLATIEPSLPARFFEAINNWDKVFHYGSYMGCLSEHQPADDQYGKLSMWRAYGGEAGAALILNAEHLIGLPSDRGVVLYPVLYSQGKEIATELAEFADCLDARRSQMQACPLDDVLEFCVDWFRITGCTTKHPAFAEEKEWRLLALHRHTRVNPLLPLEVEVIRGVPQNVIKLSLTHQTEPVDFDLSVPRLLKKILIGPCDDPDQIMQALAHDMRNAGVPNDMAHASTTGIPLRRS
jgi:hypothetical protein